MWPRYNLMPGLMQWTRENAEARCRPTGRWNENNNGRYWPDNRLNIISELHDTRRQQGSSLTVCFFGCEAGYILPALKSSDHGYCEKIIKEKSRLAPPQQTRAWIYLFLFHSDTTENCVTWFTQSASRKPDLHHVTTLIHRVMTSQNNLGDNKMQLNINMCFKHVNYSHRYTHKK